MSKVSNADITFKVSAAALARLHALANEHRASVSSTFRRKAYALVYAGNYQFELSGAPLALSFSAGLDPNVYIGLVDLCRRLDVPVETIGELVCAYVPSEYDRTLWGAPA